MRLDEYARCDGLELARLVRSGKLSRQELADTAAAAGWGGNWLTGCGR